MRSSRYPSGGNIVRRGSKGFGKIFVTNLPTNIDWWSVRNLFSKFGKLVRVFVSKKQHYQGRSTFAFVDFEHRRDAEKALRSTTWLSLHGYRLQIKQASQKAPQRNKQDQHRSTRGTPRKVWLRKDRHQRCNDELGEPKSSNEGKKTIVLPVAGENIEWLKRSIVVESQCSFDLEGISQVVEEHWGMDVNVVFLSRQKFILIFPNEEILVKEMSDQSSKLHFEFHEMARWNESHRATSREGWLSIRGLPPHGWSINNILLLASIWGQPCYVDTRTAEMQMMNEARVKVDFKYNIHVKEEVLVQIGSRGFEISVMEVEDPVMRSDQQADLKRERSNKDGEESLRCADETAPVEAQGFCLNPEDEPPAEEQEGGMGQTSVNSDIKGDIQTRSESQGQNNSIVPDNTHDEKLMCNKSQENHNDGAADRRLSLDGLDKEHNISDTKAVGGGKSSSYAEKSKELVVLCSEGIVETPIVSDQGLSNDNHDEYMRKLDDLSEKNHASNHYEEVEDGIAVKETISIIKQLGGRVLDDTKAFEGFKLRRRSARIALKKSVTEVQQGNELCMPERAGNLIAAMEEIEDGQSSHHQEDDKE